MLVPFLFSFMTSLKTKKQFDTTDPLTLPDPLTLDNYTALFGDKYDFIVPIAVTIQVVLVLTIGQMVFSVLAAYAFAQLHFPGREVIFLDVRGHPHGSAHRHHDPAVLDADTHGASQHLY